MLKGQGLDTFLNLILKLKILTILLFVICWGCDEMCGY